MKILQTVCSVLILLVIVSGCSAASSEERGVLSIKSFELFEGGDKRYQPFLGSMSGAVKLSYKGTKSNVRVSMEVWENGALKEPAQSSLSSAIQQSQNGDRVMDGELVVSVKQQADETTSKQTKYNVTVALNDQGGTTSSEYEVAADFAGNASMPIVLGKDELTIDETEEVAVWGMQASENGMQTVSLTQEMLKQVKWAVIFKISLSD
ncbi:hypothetical protein [Paenibacillus paridis]|uniref:hypothetical protein n=1 Tax=Paenibacillus paridis TaxID=2583376 RepID=UPI001120B476|nr:hypothetical protein [Paenibacillus paridis]